MWEGTSLVRTKNMWKFTVHMNACTASRGETLPSGRVTPNLKSGNRLIALSPQTGQVRSAHRSSGSAILDDREWPKCAADMPSRETPTCATGKEGAEGGLSVVVPHLP